MQTYKQVSKLQMAKDQFSSQAVKQQQSELHPFTWRGYCMFLEGEGGLRALPTLHLLRTVVRCHAESEVGESSFFFKLEDWCLHIRVT